MKTTRVPRHNCPWCGAELDAVAGTDDRPPKPGDLTICGYCIGLAQFGENLELEKPTRCTVEEAEQILRLFYEEGDGKVH